MPCGPVVSNPLCQRAARLAAWSLAIATLLIGEPQAAGAADPDEVVRAVAREAARCTVGIYCQKDGYSSFFGTGAVITADGQILTSTTVVPAGAQEILVVFPEFVTRPGKITDIDEALETTIVKVEANNLPCLPLAPNLPAVGSTAYTTSNANNVLRLNGQPSFSRGLVSGVYEVANQGGESLYAGLAVETSAAVNPGSDGGPILNEQGQICAVISLNVSPLRWQGVGVPTKVLRERLESLKSGRVKPSFGPLAGIPGAGTAPSPLTRRAAELSKSLVGISLRRKYPVEVLPRVPWPQYQRGIADWDKLSVPDKRRRSSAYFEMSRLLEVNQMLRRPSGLLTGVLVSPDGHILTSQFNVGEDAAFVSKADGKLRRFDMAEGLEKLLKAPNGGYNRESNPIQQVTVTLPDGSQREAKIVARHVPLGIALLKVDGRQLPFLDLAASGATPQLGGSVGIIGYMAGAGTRYTLNTGIVGSPTRNRGVHFQTDAWLNYGNSGGPAISGEGQFLGLAAAPLEPTTVMGRLFAGPDLTRWIMAPNSGVGFVARGDVIRQVLNELKAGKSTLQLPGAYLGVGPDPAKLFSEEIVIGAVSPKSPAETAGLKKGDRLLSLNGEELRNWRELTERLLSFKPGDKVDLKVQRPGIVQRLMIRGTEVANEEDLKKLKQSLKPGEKFEGTLVVEDTRVFTIVLGGRP
jgi:S1-C subfamily serine protease